MSEPTQYALFSKTAMRMMLSDRFELFVEGKGWIDPRTLQVGDKLNPFYGECVFVGTEQEMRAYTATHEPWM